jgi:hypothetical protein
MNSIARLEYVVDLVTIQAKLLRYAAMASFLSSLHPTDTLEEDPPHSTVAMGSGEVFVARLCLIIAE